jgi:hypothetical protein
MAINLNSIEKKQKHGTIKKTNNLHDELMIFDYIKKNLTYNSLSTLPCYLKKYIIKKYKNEVKYNSVALLSLPSQALLTKSINYKRRIVNAWLGKNELLQEVAEEFIEKTADDIIFETQMLCFGQNAQKTMNSKITCGDGYAMVKIRIKQSDIWKIFLKRDKDGRYPTHAKPRIIKKLWEKQNTKILSIIREGNEEVLLKRPLYYFDKILSSNEYFFSINVSAIRLENNSKIYYVHLNLDELEKIDEHIKKYLMNENMKNDKGDKVYKKIKTYLFSQILRASVTKFNILLKYRYHTGNNFEGKNGYKGNCCTINDGNLNKYLGHIYEEIIRILQLNKYIDKNHKNPIDSKPFKTVQKYVLGFIFYCAKELKWLDSNPNFCKKSQMWGFNLNRNYFDKKRFQMDKFKTQSKN